MPTTTTHPVRTELLATLVDELTEAVEDTVRLATAQTSALEWEVHLDYLRAVQRLARETLASAATD